MTIYSIHYQDNFFLNFGIYYHTKKIRRAILIFVFGGEWGKEPFNPPLDVLVSGIVNFYILMTVICPKRHTLDIEQLHYLKSNLWWTERIWITNHKVREIFSSIFQIYLILRRRLRIFYKSLNYKHTISIKKIIMQCVLFNFNIIQLSKSNFENSWLPIKMKNNFQPFFY